MTWAYSQTVLDKAAAYLAAGAVRRDDRAPGLWKVQGTARHPYRVQTDADAVTRTVTWITCTCPHGMNAGGGSARCAHAVAVLMMIRDAKSGLTSRIP